MTHLCHARGCEQAVPPRLLMCRRHWTMVPRPEQRAVWAHYRPGQEVDKSPTKEYLTAADNAINAVAKAEGYTAPPVPQAPAGKQLSLFRGR